MDETAHSSVVALYSRVRDLIEENPRLREILSELVESKHISSLRRTWLPRHRDMRRLQAQDPAAFGQRAISATQVQRGVATRLEKQLAGQLDAALRQIEALARQRQQLQQGTRNLSARQRSAVQNQAHALGVKQMQVATTLKANLRTAYNQAFLAGVRSSGHPVKPTQEELRWVDSAWKHELRYLNRLIGEIVAGKKVSSLTPRIRMYPRVVRAMYDAGRVAGGFPDALIYWEVDHDAEHCPDCVYLESLSPFTVQTLPTTPRAGLCRCLGNCKCRLVTVHVTHAVMRKRQRELPTREATVRRIQSARRGGS